MLTPEEQEKALKEFIARHARPYDPATDDYERPPFAADIKEGKNDPIYNAHSYHTKVPPRSIIPYILHYTQPGDLILDPFCGSGMTGVAAQMCASPPADLLVQFPELKDRVGPRPFILNDLSPAACHIAYNYNTPVDVEALRSEFDRIKVAVKDEFDWLYGTQHYEPAVGLYDPANAEVAARLKNPPTGSLQTLLGHEERIWELLTKTEVEARLGYSVTRLPRDTGWGNLDVAAVKLWVCLPAIIQYTTWSDVHRCEGLITIEEPTGKISTRGKNAGKPMVRKRRVARGCGRDITLWDAAVDPITGQVQQEFSCPSCGTKWKKTQIPRVGDRPVAARYAFCGLARSGGAVRCRVLYCEHDTTSFESARLAELLHKPIPYWVPDVELDQNGAQYRRNALSRREVFRVSDFYTKRNLWAQSRLWNEFGASAHRDALRFLFTAVTNGMTKRVGYVPGETASAKPLMKGSLYIPSFTVEWNSLPAFEVRCDKMKNALANWKPNRSLCEVLLGDAGHLPLPDNSVDYVFTDPPFGSNIYYSELGLIWEAWLGRTMDATAEAVVHRKNDGGTKRLPDYARLMQAAFAEMSRVLKPGRWATVEFNNSDGAVFEAVKAAIRGTGFEIVNMLLLDKEQKTFKQLKGVEGVEDVVDKDVLFNLRKPAAARAQPRREDQDLEQQLACAVRQHLSSLPERIKADPAKYNEDHRTTATINSVLMNALIPQGVSVERLNLPFIERVCGRYFRKVGQRWYLRGEAVGNGNGADMLVEEEVVIRDEVTAIAWLRQQVKKRPALIGELKPLWMRATGLLPAEVSQDLMLEDLLTENFWRDADTNRWREPTDEERERMNDDRSIRVLHDAERFVDGQLKRRTTDDERCEWIDVLFQACRTCEENETRAVPALRGFEPGKGYRLISRLFQSILRERVPGDVFGRAEKQARVASQRISREMDAESAAVEARQKNKDGPTLFDGLDKT